MAIITVDTLLDVVDANDGVTSLREAINSANSNSDADTIVFDASLLGGTIQLNDELELETDITIDGDVNGDNIADITLLASPSDRVLYLDSDTNIVLNSLTITGGYSNLYGGNIYANEADSLTIRDSSILGGYAYYGGGIAIFQDDGDTFTMINSLVANNEAIELGGGIYIFGVSGYGVTNIINSTLTGNEASTGGGIASIASEISLHNSTIVGNEAYFRGGGVNIDEDDVLVLTNSVIAENVSTNGFADPDIGGGPDITATNSFFGQTVIITTDNGGNINSGGDAGLGALGDQGGTVDTLYLEADSALIGAGSLSALPVDSFDLDSDGNTAENLSRDVTGNSRVVHELDIGASEFTLGQNLVVSTLVDEDDGDYSLGDLSLREAINTVRDGGTITFDSSLAGGTIVLDGILTTARDVTIDGDTDGDNAADITLSGFDTYGILALTGGTQTLSSLNFTQGYAADGGALNIGTEAAVIANDLSFFDNNVSGNGGAILNDGTLSLFNAAFGANSAGSNGGAISNTGDLTILQSTLASNQAGTSGGAIFAAGTESILSSTLTANTAQTGTGGGISDTGAAATLSNSIVAGNSASDANTDVSGSPLLVGGNIVGGDASAIFGSNTLADNGGTVQTVNIISGSAAQGAGDLTALAADSFDVDGDFDFAEALPLDANGENRSDDGALDLGAVEYIGPEFEGVLADGSAGVIMSEDAAVGTVLIDVDANDGFASAVDAGMSYSILSGNTGGTFAIDSATGVVTLADVSLIDVETGQNNFALVVQADNGAGDNNLSQVTLNVSVDDVAETFVVTTLLDVVDANDGLLSLREAIEGANKGDAQETIIFDDALEGGTLTLGSALTISEDILIDGDVTGDNRADISISGNGSQSLFTIAGSETDARLLSLNLIDAGGAVSANDANSLFIMDSTVSGSVTSGTAGAISVVDTNTQIVNSLIYDNAGSLAGGVYMDGGFLTITNSFIVGNTASAGTGGVNVVLGATGFYNSTFADNTGSNAGGVSASGVAIFVNTAVSGNVGGTGSDAAQASNLVSTNSFFDTSVIFNIDLGGNINGGGDAGLTALFDRGATTLTLGHSSTSQLVDAGSNAALPDDNYDIDNDGITTEALPLDARGDRIQNGTVDIGAMEQTALETLTATDNGETIVGSGVSDTINALAGNDLVNAGSGDDIINGGDGNDNLRGDAGNDELYGGFGADILRGGAGADVLNGGAGTDVADYTTSGGAIGVTVNLTTGINTGGDAEGDTIFFIDRVNGSSRADHITGNAAVNYLRGFAQDDTLIGGLGNDYLQGDAGADTLDGGAGTNDWAYYASSTVGVTVSLQDTSVNTGEAIGDTYINIENLLGSNHGDNLTGDASNNFVRGLRGDDDLFGGDGNDFLRGDQGADHHDGGTGVDWVYYATSSTAITIDLAAGTASGGDAVGDTFSSIERVYGSSFADSITGDSGANYLRGSFGNDTLIGGDGTDFLQGDSGFDVLDGGAGSDWAYYASAGVGTTINLGDSSQNTGEAIGDTYISIENVVGSRFDDTITGDAGDNYLRGFTGDDTLNGGLGDDVLRGENGNDTFVFTDAAWGDDKITDFSNGNDMLDFSALGYELSDFTVTQNGNDTLLTLITDTDQTLLLQNFDAVDLDVADFI